MTVLEAVHDAHGATFAERGGRRFVVDYGRPAVTHRAVRNGVGVLEVPRGVVVLTGADRVEFVDDAVSNRVPDRDGQGCYAVLLDPQGRVRTDLYVLNAGERLLVFTPPGEAAPLAEEWAGRTFVQDVDVRAATDEFATFGVHGPDATEKIASVLHGAGAPEEPLSFVRGELGDAGVSVVAGDGLAGEDGHEVVCAADDAEAVFDTLVARGLNAVPFGAATWDTLTLEAGTPLFETELDGRVPNQVGLRVALNFEKGCYVGQEVVSRVENRGAPSKRLAGLRPGAVPDAGAAVLDGDATVGEVTRAADAPSLDAPAALAVLDDDAATGETDLSVRVDGEAVPAERTSLPFVEGSATSRRLPRYD
jgi:aminomethyltransferase